MENSPVTTALIRVFNVPPDFITILIIAVCLALFAPLRFPHIERLRNIAPGLMISAGILGTFWGTLIALNGFNTGGVAAGEGGGINHSAMVESIPLVLSGMKSAFMTSLIGLFSAFVFRVLDSFLPAAQSAQPELLPVEKDYLALLQGIKEAINGEKDNSMLVQLSNMRREMRDNAQELKDILGGQDESSLMAQLSLFRNESAGKFDAIRAVISEQSGKLDSINQHMEGLADAIKESLVKNLESLITEIKTVISEQLVEQLKSTNEILSKQMEEMLQRIEKALLEEFGSTFKEFNEATLAIKAWQEQHKQQVEQLTDAFQICADGIGKIQVSCQAIPDSVEQLNVIMGELDSRLKAFAGLKEQAENVLPVIKQHLDQIGEDLKDSAYGLNSTIDAMRGNIESQQDALTKQIDGFIERMGKIAEEHASSVNGVVKDITQQWGDQVVSITDHVADRIGRGRGRR